SRLGAFLHPQDHAQHFGSLKSPTPKTLMSIFAYLYAQVIQAKHRFDTIALYNHYNIWMWHILLLFTGARPVKDFPGLLKDIDLDQVWFWRSDKLSNTRKDYWRILPLCYSLRRELQSFKQYVRQYTTSVESQIENGAQHIEDILESKRPLLTIIIANQRRTLSP